MTSGGPADEGEPCVLLVVRHGRTPLTEQGRFSGGGRLDPGLSEAGVADAERVAVLLAALPVSPAAAPAAAAAIAAAPAASSTGLPDVGAVSAVVCSPSARTRQTADVVAGRLGLPVEPDPDWCELGFGAWDGLTYAEVAAQWPVELAAWQGDGTVAPPGGESLVVHERRIRAARARRVAARPGRTVVVVTHTTPARVVVREALDAGPATLWRARISPCSVTAVRYWRDGGTEVVTVNRLP